MAPIRLGGIPQAYARQLLLVGDAAGHVDPLTGEGIHTAMIAGKLAAITVDEMHKKDNFSLAACKAYGNSLANGYLFLNTQFPFVKPAVYWGNLLL